ncbi:MAG: histidine phosphatase family protein [Candidatus Omnitrophica bacterium]|nr:histidine phosphatase family protein [Candidatus Omnitrophota bacterium]
MKIYLIRHGETTWNKKEMVQGNSDPLLSALGRRQAALLARELKGRGIDKICSSPLRRAHSTARAVAGSTGAPIEIHHDLREINLGAWEGKTISQIRKSHPAEYRKWLRGPSYAKIKEAEHILDFKKRALDAFHGIVSTNGSRSVAIITHGGVIISILSHILRVDFNRLFKTLRVDNCGIHELEHINGLFFIGTLNSTSWKKSR